MEWRVGSMHTLVRRYIKTSFVFLVAGLLLGFYLTVGRYVVPVPTSIMLVTAHTHLLLVGFVMMMILGVAQWMFPRPEKSDEHYDPMLAGIVFYAFTTGVILRSAGEIAAGFSGSVLFPVLITAGSAVEVLAVIVFFYNIWTRIRPVGSHLREAKGERF
jgi:heme/copper-type cytochrome/quinol oxidase subunit 1